MTIALPGVRQLRLPTLDARVVGGVVLVAVSIIGGLGLSADPEPTTPVYVASTELDAGHVLTRKDLKVAELRAPQATLNGLAQPSRGGPPVGRALQTALRANATVGLDGLGPTAPPGRQITIPVTADHALGGAVRTGDRVDVLATFDKGTDAARTLTVARAATVHGLVQSDGLFGQHAGAITALTLDVRPDAAIGVAFAARNAELDVVRSIGIGARRGRSRYDAGDVR